VAASPNCSVISPAAIRTPTSSAAHRARSCCSWARNGYVSASWFTDRTRTPTWNYAAAQFLVDIELVEDEAGTAHVLRDLVGAMEQGRLRPGRSKRWVRATRNSPAASSRSAPASSSVA
jgi:hypothetical protein